LRANGEGLAGRLEKRFLIRRNGLVGARGEGARLRRHFLEPVGNDCESQKNGDFGDGGIEG